MRYDIKALSRIYGFEPHLVEKVLRISDILQELSRVSFLQKRLCLYGGTALNFIFFPGFPRLSFDLDFNYRQIDECDWGDTRDEIDLQLKRVLKDQGYLKVAIQPSYPLLRMDVSYLNQSGLSDSFKIEIGYMRRITVLKSDTVSAFHHLEAKKTFSVLTPQKEELFANKVATFLSRGRGRDLFDVYHIGHIDFDWGLFRKCFIAECLMHDFTVDHVTVSKLLKSIVIESTLNEMVRHRKVPNDMVEVVESFLEKLFGDITEHERRVIDNFSKKGIVDFSSIDDGDLNPLLVQHPAILWLLKKRFQ